MVATIPKEKANMLNELFQSVCTHDGNSILPEIFFSFPIDDTEIVVQSQGVFQSDFEYELFEC